MWLKPFYVTFVYLSIFWPSGHNLAFKKFVRTLDSQIDLFGSIIIMYEWYETNFEYFDLLLCDLAFLAKGVAFLALTTLKLQNTENHMIKGTKWFYWWGKIIDRLYLGFLAFNMTFKIFFGLLFNFYCFIDVFKAIRIKIVKSWKKTLT